MVRITAKISANTFVDSPALRSSCSVLAVGDPIEVSDQGIGIGPEQMPYLFQPFSRLEEQRAREIKGIGLGLYISQGIVEAHGGRIWVESALGKGTTFHVMLPAQPVHEPAGTA